MNAYINTPLENLSADDLRRIVDACNSEITRREDEHYNNLYGNVIESLTEMVKYFPNYESIICPSCGEEYDWEDILRMIKNYHE